MIELNPVWLRKVAGAIGKTEKETQGLIQDWYDHRVPLKQMEVSLSEMAKANGKQLSFAAPGLN